jgi:hypothetical protein
VSARDAQKYLTILTYLAKGLGENEILQDVDAAPRLLEEAYALAHALAKRFANSLRSSDTKRSKKHEN